jgi:hypothetical protein
MTHPTDTGKNTDNATLSIPAPRKPAKSQVENREFAAFARRIIRAHARRVAACDVEALTDLVTLAADIDTAITDAIRGLHACGYSDAEIGSRLGVTKQAVQKRRTGGQS